MSRRMSCLVVATCLALSASLVDAQIRNRAGSEAERRDTASEIARRADPQAVERVRRALGELDGRTGAQAVSDSLSRHGLQLKLDTSGTAKVLRIRVDTETLRLSDAGSGDTEATKLFLRTARSIARREDIIRRTGATSEKTLDARPRTDSEELGLDRYLRDSLGISDYSAVAASFDQNALVKELVLSSGLTVARLYGGKSTPVGRYFFCCVEAPSTVPREVLDAAPSARIEGWTDASGLALPPDNLAEHLALVTLPPNTKVLIGTVADNFAGALGEPELGGGTQIFVPHVQNFPFESYRRADNGAPVSEIAVLRDDLIVRYRR
jgi:hypothetical protein